MCLGRTCARTAEGQYLIPALFLCVKCYRIGLWQDSVHLRRTLLIYCPDGIGRLLPADAILELTRLRQYCRMGVIRLKIAVVGAGKLGYDVSRILSEEKHDVIVIDKDPEALKAIAQNLDVMTVVGNGASAGVLQDVGIETVDILLAVTDNDELNMIACMTGKQFGVGMTVARVRNPDYTPSHPLVLSNTQFGIDLLISPEHLAAQEIFRLIEVPSASDIEYFADGRLSLIAVKIDQNLAVSGRYIRELEMKRFTVVAIVRENEIIIPNGDTQMLPKDKVYVLGRTTGFHDLNGLMRRNQPKFGRVVIAGGGLTTQYLAKLLLSRKQVPEIKIIEPNLDRCRSLATELARCGMICGDATKFEILEEERIGAKDVFIAMTGSDNSNLVACMQASRLGVKEIICEASREDYIPLAETIGATATVTPRLLTASTLLKLVRSSNVVTVNLLHRGDAQIVEVVADTGSPATKKPLRELDLPRGVIVGAVIHDAEILVPRGDTAIKPGDHVIISSLKSQAALIERVFRARGEAISQ